MEKVSKELKVKVAESLTDNKELSIFEDFLEYCKEDNEKLVNDIESWLADYFDLPNRVISLSKGEKKWIKENLSFSNQMRILGKII